MKAHRTWLSLRWRLVALFAAFMVIESYPAYGQNGAVGIAYPAKGITIDGDLSDWPKGLRTYPIDRIEYGDKLAGKDDLKAQFRIAYNAAEHAPSMSPSRCGTIPIVLDGPGQRQVGRPGWLRDLHRTRPTPAADRPSSSMPDTATRTRSVGPSDATEKTMKVAVARTESRIIYEWRIEVGAELDPDRVIGFDVSVADKDKDGSFSWAAWGSGTQKARHARPLRRVPSRQPRDGVRRGFAARRLERPVPAALPSRVRIQSTRSAPLWRAAIVDPSGAYKATTLPAGPYSIQPWIRPTSASTRSRTSTSRSRPTSRRRPSSSASCRSPGPG